MTGAPFTVLNHTPDARYITVVMPCGTVWTVPTPPLA